MSVKLKALSDFLNHFYVGLQLHGDSEFPKTNAHYVSNLVKESPDFAAAVVESIDAMAELFLLRGLRFNTLNHEQKIVLAPRLMKVVDMLKDGKLDLWKFSEMVESIMLDEFMFGFVMSRLVLFMDNADKNRVAYPELVIAATMTEAKIGDEAMLVAWFLNIWEQVLLITTNQSRMYTQNHKTGLLIGAAAEYIMVSALVEASHHPLDDAFAKLGWATHDDYVQMRRNARAVGVATLP